MTDPVVRLAKSADVNDLIALVKEAHEEEHIGPCASLNEERVFEQILRALSGRAVIGVIGEPGELQSSAYLSIARPWYSQTPIVESLFFYTRPEFRRSTNSKSLLTWVKKQAERLGCPLQIEAPTTELNKPKLALCERVLGAPAGFSWFYIPKPDELTEQGPILVEPATPNSEPEVFDTIRKLVAENGAYQPDEQMAIPLLRDALAGNGVIGIIRPEKDIEGMIFLRVETPWYSDQPFLDEFFAFVPERYRKTQNAKALVQFAKRQSDRLDIPLRIGVISKIELARKIAMYSRLLSEPSHAHFLYKPT